MSYYPVPPEVLEDSEMLDTWVQGALMAARRAATKTGTKRTTAKRSRS